jgi:hypothetical protein
MIMPEYQYRIRLTYILLLCVAFFFHGSTQAQNIKKEVYVVSTFRPEVADVDKISIMPTIADTIKIDTRIDYTVLPSRIKSDFSMRPIKSAKMVGTPLDKLYNSYLKLGIGNYITPLAEFSIHNLRSKEYAVGAYIFHKSSYTKLKLDNGVKVPAGYGKNDLALYGKRFYENVNLTADVGANTNRVRHYGYNTSIFAPDSLPDLDAQDIKQSFFKVYAKASVHSTATDSNAFHYLLALGGEYFRDHFSTKQPGVDFSTSLKYHIKSWGIGLDGDLNHYTHKDGSGSYKMTLLELKPYVKKQKYEWKVELGGRLFYDSKPDNQVIYIFPEGSIRFQIIDNALITFFGVTGYIENNSYASISEENPFVIPGTMPENTIHKFMAYGGLDGRLSRNSSYRLSVTFDARENVIFYLNDTLSRLQNQFSIVYDDADLIKYYGEIQWSPFSYMSFFLKSNLYSYKMVNEDKPWHKPSFDLLFTSRYNFKEKIFVDIDFVTLGKRYAINNAVPEEPIQLDPVYDLNLKLEYKYSNILTGFIHFYNLLAQNYSVWNQYPSQRLNVLLGVTYKF